MSLGISHRRRTTAAAREAEEAERAEVGETERGERGWDSRRGGGVSTEQLITELTKSRGHTL